LRSGNPEEIARALDELQQAYSAAGASLYAAARGADASSAGPEGGAAAGGQGEAGAPKQDNVVDADYEIVDDDKGKKA
jgi:molecular chaperone DnaK